MSHCHCARHLARHSDMSCGCDNEREWGGTEEECEQWEASKATEGTKLTGHSRNDELTFCTKCEKGYPSTTEFFGANPRKRNGLQSHCRECCRAVAREKQRQRRADPIKRVKLLEEKKRYIQSDKGREWKRVTSFVENHKRRHPIYDWSYEQWERCVRYWGGRCAYCGSDGRLEHDHVIPCSSPDCPGTVPWNIVPACAPCSRRKGAKALEAWAAPDIVASVRSYLSAIMESRAS